MNPIQIRAANKDDISFVYAVWLRSYKHDSPQTNYIHADVFFPNHQRALDLALSDPNVLVSIACDHEDPGLIFGFLASEPRIKTVHYIYVKKPFRERGFAAMLLEHQGIPKDCEGWMCSHLTKSLLDLWGNHKTRVRFNPYALERNNESAKNE